MYFTIWKTGIDKIKKTIDKKFQKYIIKQTNV